MGAIIRLPWDSHEALQCLVGSPKGLIAQGALGLYQDLQHLHLNFEACPISDVNSLGNGIMGCTEL